jgi:amidase/aspartyl-tRNA(Asn)/glutamyl-tRNA(Gln) amidotransferase subunit A
VDPLSPDELDGLAERFGVGLPDAQAETVRDQVNDFLRPLDDVERTATPADRGPAGGERSWRAPDPGEDPHAAVAHYCDVPPAGDGPLSGVDVGVKEIVAVAGVPMECGSDVMRGHVPGRDAAVVTRLREAGGRVTATLACDEFAGSARGTTGADGPVRNPHDSDRTAGGSSGGSAAAVATGDVDAALGTDTGGSVRIPAAFCGVVGVKPTHGLVPLAGVVENTYTQDHVGPLAGSVVDCARVLDAVAGASPDDPASTAAAGRESYRVGGYAEAATDPPDAADLTLGVVDEGLGDGVRPEVAARTEAAAEALADAGATVERVSVPRYHDTPVVKNLLSLTELAAHWRAGGAPYRRGGVVDPGHVDALTARTRAHGERLGPYYRSKLLAGAHLLEHGGRLYTRAQAAREAVRESFEAALDGRDALVAPTMPAVAPPVADAADPGFDYARNTRPANVTRQPGVTLPNGDVGGLPVGLHLQGAPFTEARLLGVAARVEATLA